jgi:hypothetical protein
MMSPSGATGKCAVNKFVVELTPDGTIMKREVSICNSNIAAPTASVV